MTDSAKDRLVGTRIREYEIIQVLGKGGMGAVYKARHVYLDEYRAIKIVDANQTEDEDFVDRFIREAKILTRFRHSNLVQLFEFGTLQQTTFFMVMEFIEGESLLKRLQANRRIPIRDALGMICQAAYGLHAAHQRGVVHRDISPDNLILCAGEDGTEVIKVIDFGIAKPLYEPARQYISGAKLFLGKPEYASPEQCGTLLDGETIDHRSDIYSLAVTLYHMLAGKLPFHSKTPQGYLLKHANEIPKPVSQLLEGQTIPPALDAAILKALAKKREERQPSMMEFAREIKEAFDSTNVPDPVLHSSPGPRHASDLREGEVFGGRYLIEKQIGQGSMGVVYKARDRILDVAVAVKALNDEVSEDQKAMERFKREVILARRVSHPNVCRIYDIGESDSIHYVSMEFISGKTLSDLLQQEGSLTVNVGIPIIRQVLYALQEAHRAGVIHRDLKPRNIMVDLAHRAYIMDWGISFAPDSPRVTSTGSWVGTPQYMAPEQFEDKRVDHRADIYSLGVILFEIFTGRLPFISETPLQVIYSHLKVEPPRPTNLKATIPADLEKVILKALRKDPKDRYQNIRELLEALKPLCEPTTDLAASNKEQMANKLLAEQKYSAAIGLLDSWLKSDPSNEQWKKLRNIAAVGKIQKDLHRVRKLIRKKNFVDAQVLLQQISTSPEKKQRITTQIRKLGKLLNAKRQQQAEDYLQQAEKLLSTGDSDGARSCLEAAQKLDPENARVAEVFNRLNGPGERKGTFSGATRYEVIEPRMPSGVFSLIETVLREEKETGHHVGDTEQVKAPIVPNQSDSLAEIPSASDPLMPGPVLNLPSIQTREGETEEVKGPVLKQQRIKEAFEFGRELYQHGRWDDAIQQWSSALEESPNDTAITDWIAAARAQMEVEEKLRQWLDEQLQDAAKKIEEKKFPESRAILVKAQEAIPNSVQFENHQKLIERLFQHLETNFEAEDERLRREYDSLSDEGERLFADQIYADAIRKWSDALQIYPLDRSLEPRIQEARARLEEEERSSRFTEPYDDKQETDLRRKDPAEMFQVAFLKGKNYFDEMDWPRAIECWNEALQISSDDVLGQWIAAAGERLRYEQEIRSYLDRELATAEQLLAKKQFDAVNQCLHQCQKSISNEYNLKDYVERFEQIRKQVEEDRRKERDFTEAIQKELEDASWFFQQKAFRPALSIVNSVLEQAPNTKAASQLKAKILKAVEERSKLLSHVEVIVKLMAESRFAAQRPFLKRLKSVARGSSYEKEIDHFVEQIIVLAKEIESGEYKPAQKRLESLLAMSPFLQIYEEKVKLISKNLTEEEQKAVELASVFRKGIQNYQKKNWKEAISCFRRLEELNPGNPQVLEYLSRSLKEESGLGGSEMNHHVQMLLDRGGKFFEERRLDEARETFQEALRWDPQNEQARQGLRKVRLERTTQIFFTPKKKP